MLLSRSKTLEPLLIFFFLRERRLELLLQRRRRKTLQNVVLTALLRGETAAFIKRDPRTAER